MLISHVGDLAVSVADVFISYLSERLGHGYGSKVFEGIGSIYLGIAGCGY